MDKLLEISNIWINLEAFGDITNIYQSMLQVGCCFPSSVPPLRGELSSHGTTQSAGLVLRRGDVRGRTSGQVNLTHQTERNYQHK